MPKFLFLLIFLTYLFFPLCVKASVVFYPNTPGEVLDNTFQLKINGTAQNLEYHNTHHLFKYNGVGIESLRVRYAQDSASTITLTSNLNITGGVLRSAGLDFPVNINGNTVSFTITRPGIYRLYLNNFNKTIYFFVDPVVLDRPSNFTNVNSLGISSNSTLLQTTKIQQAIDNCNGCTLYFPAGVYRTGRLKIQISNINIYLEKGSLIKGPSTYADLDPDPNLRNELFYIFGATNVKVYGLGTISGNGNEYLANSDIKVHNFNVYNSSNITIKDITFMDSNSWGLHIRQSNQVFVSNTKCFSGKDCYDVDSSTNIFLENIFAQSIDDGVAVKAMIAGAPASNVVITSCYVNSWASSFKIGTENQSQISNVNFRLCDADNLDRGINLTTGSGSAIFTNNTYRYIRLFGGLIPIVIDGDGAKKAVRHTTFIDIQSDFPSPATITGADYTSFNNLTIYAGLNGGGEHLINVLAYATNNSLSNANVYWQNNAQFWDTPFSNADIPYSNVTENSGFASSQNLNYLFGDFDLNGSIGIAGDILPLLKAAMSSNSLYYFYLDTNADSKIDLLDAVNALKTMFL